MIDTRDDDVGQVLEQPRDREMHAVGRRAVDVLVTEVGTPHGERTIERQGIAGAGAIALGCDDRDFTEWRERFGQSLKARGEVTIIVAEENPHGGGRAREDIPRWPERP